MRGWTCSSVRLVDRQEEKNRLALVCKTFSPPFVRSLLTRKDERQRGLQDHLADGQVRATDEPGWPGFSLFVGLTVLRGRSTATRGTSTLRPTTYDRSALAAPSRPPVLPSSRPPVLDFPDRPPTLSFFPHPDSRPYRQQPSRRAGSSSKRRTKSPPRLPSPPKRSSTSQNCSCSRARRQRCDGTLIGNKRQTRSRRRSSTAST